MRKLLIPLTYSIDQWRINGKFIYLLILPFCLFRATLAAHGGSQARVELELWAWLIPQPQQCQIQAMSVTYTTAHGKDGSLTHRVRPGFEPATSWLLVGFVNH